MYKLENIRFFQMEDGNQVGVAVTLDGINPAENGFIALLNQDGILPLHDFNPEIAAAFGWTLLKNGRLQIR